MQKPRPAVDLCNPAKPLQATWALPGCCKVPVRGRHRVGLPRVAGRPKSPEILTPPLLAQSPVQGKTLAQKLMPRKPMPRKPETTTCISSWRSCMGLPRAASRVPAAPARVPGGLQAEPAAGDRRSGRHADQPAAQPRALPLARRHVRADVRPRPVPGYGHAVRAGGRPPGCTGSPGCKVHAAWFVVVYALLYTRPVSGHGHAGCAGGGRLHTACTLLGGLETMGAASSGAAMLVVLVGRTCAEAAWYM